MLKANDLDDSPSLVDAIIKQVISVDEFQDTESLFYFGSAIRHEVKTHRKVDKLEAYFSATSGLWAAMYSTIPVRFLIA
jgi:hypothetical protein